MSNLILRPSEIIRGVKIREVESPTEKIKQIYRKALVTCGYKNFDAETVSLQVAILEKSLKQHYGGVTLEEFEYSAEKGAIGYYGEFMGLSPKTFISWLQSYLNSHERKEAFKLRKSQQKELPKASKMTDEEKKEFWEESKKSYKKSGDLLGGVFLFEVGCDLGLIDLSNIEEIKKEALEWFENEKTRLISEEGLGAKIVIGKLNEVIKSNEKDRSSFDLWQNRCKRIAVINEFRR